ncbi:glucuronate isomerase [Planctomycetota bacterium]
MTELPIEAIQSTVEKTVRTTPIYDIHTHLYDLPFGGLLLWGIDELITYHYLIAEVFRQAPRPYADFWALDKKAQAELIWEELFIRHSPISEACRGILTCLHELGVDTSKRDLSKIRAWFEATTVEAYVDTVFETGNVEAVVMTNNPFDDEERPVWERGVELDPRFKPALRIDNLLVDFDNAAAKLKEWGYAVDGSLGTKDIAEIKRFLEEWIERMQPLYMAASLPPSFAFPEDSACGTVLEECILPISASAQVPFAMMIGVKKLTNPELRLAGDSVGKSSIEAVEYLCANYPDNKFLVTFLARENQHEACIAARKFHNLMLFGCWWYLNNPSIIDEMTRMRMETLGLSFIPQHSDARVLDQLIYKWSHSRGIIADVLTDKYTDLAQAGWRVTEAEIERDVKDLFGNNFRTFLER